MLKIKKTFRVVIPAICLPVIWVVLAGCESQEKWKAEFETIQENKDFITVYTEDFWNNHNVAAFEIYFSDDFVMHFANEGQNTEQYKGLCQAYFAAFPDLYITIDDLIAEGDKVTKVWTAHSTHRGEFMGIPATGKRITVKGIEVFRIADGKIVELWASMDNLGMLQQLGVIPAMGE